VVFACGRYEGIDQRVIDDAVRRPSREGARRRGVLLLPRESDVRRRDGNAVLPLRVAQAERRDETTVGCVGVVGHDAKSAVLESGNGLRESRNEFIVRIASDERFGHGGCDEARRGIVVEHRARLTDETDDDIASRGRGRRARRAQADDDHECE